MTIPKELSEFTRQALQSGQSREDIRIALQSAGWTETEIADALAAWVDGGPSGPVPRPVRSSAAKEAFFYALLFVAFGMVAGNVLALAFGQIEIWLPEPTDNYSRYAIRALRWSMAALIVFVPAFLALDWIDRRGARKDPARKHGTIRHWLSFLAMFIAVTTLMCDALYLIYTFLDGQLTTRFLSKSTTVALLALVVLAYFRQDRQPFGLPLGLHSTVALGLLAALMLGLSLWTIGGPAQGQKELRDRWRISDLRTLAADLQECAALPRYNLPQTFDPMDCADHPEKLTGYASEIAYSRVSSTEFKLCIEVEFPAAVESYYATTMGNTACISRSTRY